MKNIVEKALAAFKGSVEAWKAAAELCPPRVRLQTKAVQATLEVIVEEAVLVSEMTIVVDPAMPISENSVRELVGPIVERVSAVGEQLEIAVAQLALGSQSGPITFKNLEELKASLLAEIPEGMAKHYGPAIMAAFSAWADAIVTAAGFTIIEALELAVTKQ